MSRWGVFADGRLLTRHRSYWAAIIRAARLNQYPYNRALHVVRRAVVSHHIDNGENVSEVIRRALADYIREGDPVEPTL